MADKDLALAASLADTSKLTPFEGLDVVRSTIAITGAGDGLSAAMAVEPVAYHHGDTVYVLMECVVADVQHPPLSKDTPDVLVRKHKFRAQAATVVDDAWAVDAIKAQTQKIERAKDEARGQARLTGETDSDVNPDAAAADGGEPVSTGDATVMSFPKGGKAKAPAKAKLDEKPARDALRQLSRQHLRDLMGASNLPCTTKTKAQDMIDALVAYAGEVGGQSGLDAQTKAAEALHGTGTK